MREPGGDLRVPGAALLASLVNDHTLVDGNKRLGWAATVVFCELNGRDLVGPTQDAVFELVMSVADGALSDVAKLADVLSGWLHQTHVEEPPGAPGHPHTHRRLTQITATRAHPPGC